MLYLQANQKEVAQKMTKEAVLKDYPSIPSDADLGIFLFFMGWSAL